MVTPESEGAAHDRVAPPRKDPTMTTSHAPHHALTRHLRRLPLAAALLALVWAAPAAPAQAQAPTPPVLTTFNPVASPKCNEPVYTVPAGIRYIQVTAIGGAGAGGSSVNATNTGGKGGFGAEVAAI